MRHLFVIIDSSRSMEDQDLKPNRLTSSLKVSSTASIMEYGRLTLYKMSKLIFWILQLMEYFVEEYFDQNPISQVMHLTLYICLWVFTECAASVNCTVLSQIGIIATKNKRAEKLTDLAGWYISRVVLWLHILRSFLISYYHHHFTLFDTY